MICMHARLPLPINLSPRAHIIFGVAHAVQIGHDESAPPELKPLLCSASIDSGAQHGCLLSASHASLNLTVLQPPPETAHCSSGQLQ